MRRIAPFLTFLVVAGALYWALEGAPGGPRRRAEPGKHQAAEDATSRPRAAESRPDSRPRPADPVAAAESGPATSRPETAASRPESGPASAPVVPVVVIEVVREDGKPIDAAHVDVRAGQPTATVWTDAAGRVEIPARTGENAELAVWGSNFCTFETTIALDSGTRRVVVPNRSKVAGHVTVDGRIPGEPIMIKLSSALCSHPATDVGGTHHTATDETGAFEFFNLPSVWTGELDIPGVYTIVDRLAFDVDGQHDDSNTIRLPAPHPTLAIKLGELPAIKGRILSHGTREGLQGSLIAKFQMATESGSTQSWADPSGRFRVLLDRDTVHVTLAIADARFLGTRTIEVQGPFDQGRNLGDIEIDSVHQIAFRVRDTSGHPIAGAVGEISETWSESEPTDDEGKSVISTDQGKRELRVGKLGYATTAVPVPEDSTAPLDVELRPGNQLVIAVRLADGSIPGAGHPSPCVHLSSTDALFAGPHDMLDALLRRTGVSESFEEGKGAEGSNIAFVPDEHGRVVVAGFRPGAEVLVQLRGPMLDELLDESFVVMNAAGTKTITLHPQVMPQQFVGVVRTRNGDPIDGASVSMWVKESRNPGRETASGAEGRFEIGAIFASSVHVLIEKEGFVPLRQHDVPVPLNGAQHDFILIPSHDVTIVLVDESGRRVVEEAEVVVRISGAPEDEQPGAPEDLGDGSYVARGLPPGPIEITASVGVCHVGIQHDSRTHTARLVIPSEGGAELHWRRDRPDPARCRVRVESVPAGAMGFVGEVPAEVTDHYIEAKLPPGTYWAAVEGFDETDSKWIELASSGTFRIEVRKGILVEIAR